MERETGIEPATSSLGSWRSTAELLPLSHTRILILQTLQDPSLRSEFRQQAPASLTPAKRLKLAFYR
jgi:hypothetical protein